MRTTVLRRYVVQYWVHTLHPLCGRNSILLGTIQIYQQLQGMWCRHLRWCWPRQVHPVPGWNLERVNRSKQCGFVHPLSRWTFWNRARRQERLSLHGVSQRDVFRGRFDILHQVPRRNVQRPARLHIGGFLRELSCRNIQPSSWSNFQFELSHVSRWNFLSRPARHMRQLSRRIIQCHPGRCVGRNLSEMSRLHLQFNHGCFVRGFLSAMSARDLFHSGAGHESVGLPTAVSTWPLVSDRPRSLHSMRSRDLQSQLGLYERVPVHRLPCWPVFEFQWTKVLCVMPCWNLEQQRRCPVRLCLPVVPCRNLQSKQGIRRSE